MKKWSYLLILLGIVVLIYPQASEWYADWQQERLLAQAEQSEQSVHPVAKNNLNNEYSRVNALLNEGAAADNKDSGDDTATQGDIIGIITIPVIDVKLPIIEGATRDNMRSAAVHISETSPLGTIGNFAVAAHRAHKYGRLFNRLGEVKLGDVIQIEAQGRMYTYTVDHIQIVEPTDVAVLNANGKEQELTLVTCDPLINPTHRLIVHAHRTDHQS
ncbi:class D sortase [Paenibacillus campi]|uniref:class D sortase n=1 Tax=Paenibacillus campi TaxID=3106031 RepID=UPI002AFE9F74|nr:MULTISPECIES: class D sortase [unclassified Paenibacillus]